MPLKLTRAERARIGKIRARLKELEEGRRLAQPLLDKLTPKLAGLLWRGVPELTAAMEGMESDLTNTRWLLALLDREDAR